MNVYGIFMIKVFLFFYIPLWSVGLVAQALNHLICSQTNAV